MKFHRIIVEHEAFTLLDVFKVGSLGYAGDAYGAQEYVATFKGNENRLLSECIGKDIILFIGSDCIVLIKLNKSVVYTELNNATRNITSTIYMNGRTVANIAHEDTDSAIKSYNLYRRSFGLECLDALEIATS